MNTPHKIGASFDKIEILYIRNTTDYPIMIEHKNCEFKIDCGFLIVIEEIENTTYTPYDLKMVKAFKTYKK